MATETTPRLMTKAEYAKHRGVSKPYITKLAKNGVLVLRGGKVDVAATDTVLDDKPVDDVDPPPPMQQPVGAAPPARPADGLGQGGASFGPARTIEMVFRAKLRRLEFETKQGKLIEAEDSPAPSAGVQFSLWLDRRGRRGNDEVRRVWRTQGSALYRMPCAGWASNNEL
jgi:hypothetical protein